MHNYGAAAIDPYKIYAARHRQDKVFDGGAGRIAPHRTKENARAVSTGVEC